MGIFGQEYYILYQRYYTEVFSGNVFSGLSTNVNKYIETQSDLPEIK